MRLPLIILLLASWFASADETSDYIHVRYIEAYVDITAAQRRFAIFEAVDDPTQRFEIRIFRPDPDIDDTNAYNILRLLDWFPCGKKPDQAAAELAPRYFVPLGKLSFRVPRSNP